MKTLLALLLLIPSLSWGLDDNEQFNGNYLLEWEVLHTSVNEKKILESWLDVTDQVNISGNKVDIIFGEGEAILDKYRKSTIIKIKKGKIFIKGNIDIDCDCPVDMQFNLKKNTIDNHEVFQDTKIWDKGKKKIEKIRVTLKKITHDLPVTLEKRFSIKEINGEDAVCNNGKKANYFFAEQKTNTNKWFVQLIGGGAAWNLDTYLERDLEYKKPIPKSQDETLVSSSAISAQMYSMGYNIIKLHYCSSDLYAGDHFNIINGKKIPFKGRQIIASIIGNHSEQFQAAEDLIIAGTSAGVYGIVLNFDLWQQFEEARYIFDSIWRDDFQKTLKTPGTEWIKFPLGNLPKHCEGDYFKNCFNTRSTLERHSVKEAFIIFNYGDPFLWVQEDSQIEDYVKSFIKDAEIFGGGFSVNAKKFKLRGQSKWGHGVIMKSEDYYKKMGDKSLSEVIERWILGEKSIHTHY